MIRMGGEVNEAGGREAVPGSPPAGAGCSPPLQPPDDAVTSGGGGADGKRYQPPQTAAGGQGRCNQGAATKNKGHRAPEPQSHLAPPSPPTSQAAGTHQTPAASPAPGSMPHPRILPPRPPPHFTPTTRWNLASLPAPPSLTGAPTLGGCSALGAYRTASCTRWCRRSSRASPPSAAPPIRRRPIAVKA